MKKSLNLYIYVYIYCYYYYCVHKFLSFFQSSLMLKAFSEYRILSRYINAKKKKTQRYNKYYDTNYQIDLQVESQSPFLLIHIMFVKGIMI